MIKPNTQTLWTMISKKKIVLSKCLLSLLKNLVVVVAHILSKLARFFLVLLHSLLVITLETQLLVLFQLWLNVLRLLSQTKSPTCKLLLRVIQTISLRQWKVKQKLIAWFAKLKLLKKLSKKPESIYFKKHLLNNSMEKFGNSLSNLKIELAITTSTKKKTLEVMMKMMVLTKKIF